MISLFKNSKETKPVRDITIDNYIDYVKTGLVAEEIAKIRQAVAAGDDELKDKLKKKLLAITIFGTFSVRRSNKLLTNSGLFGADIDHLSPEELERIWQALKADPHVLIMHRSASGTGLFVVIKTRSKKAKEVYLNLEHYMLNTHGIVIDSQCKDAARLRYISHDPELYHNTKHRHSLSRLPRNSRKLRHQRTLSLSGQTLMML